MTVTQTQVEEDNLLNCIVSGLSSCSCGLSDYCCLSSTEAMADDFQLNNINLEPLSNAPVDDSTSTDSSSSSAGDVFEEEQIDDEEIRKT